MTETTGENFGVKNISGVRPESALELGGSRVVSAEKLSRAWLNAQNEMVSPIADLLNNLVLSGHLKKEILAEALSNSYKTVTYARREGETAEIQVARSVSERLISILALRLSGGDAKEAQEMLAKMPGGSGVLTSNMDSLAEFVTKEARNPVKK